MSDKKLKFHVVYASSEDPQYPAAELNVHSSKSRGWASSRFCAFPQELGFAFDDGVIALSQIQLLSHQCKIAKRVELYIGFGPDYLHAEFKRLGYMSLESNERSEFKARELKSVYVSAEAQFVRLVIHECYANPHNVTKQVCIVAVNFKGGAPGASMAVGDVSKRGGRGPGVHDLSLDMRMDPETAATIRQVSELKEKAVADEDYETAKALKAVESDLLKLGSQIAMLLDEKARAVENEDYDRARELRDDVNAVRASIDQRIAASGFGRGRGAPAPTPAGRFPQSALPSPQIRPARGYEADGGGYGRGGGRAGDRAGDRGGGRGEEGYGEYGYEGEDGQLPGGALVPHDDSDLNDTIGRKAPHPLKQPPASMPRALAPAPGEGAFPGDRPIVVKGRGGAAADEGAFPGDKASGAFPGDRAGGFPGDKAVGAFPGDRAGAFPGDRAGAFPGDRAGAFPGDRAGGGAGGGEEEDDDDEGAFGGGGSAGAVGGETADPEELAGVDNVTSLPAPPPLKATLAKEFGRECGLFGVYVVSCFHAPQWGLREAALKKVELDLPTYPGPKVTLVARDLLPKVLAEVGTDVRKSDVISALEPVMTGLIDKLGDNNARVRDSVIEALMHLADGDTVGPAAVAAAVMRKIPTKQLSAWRPLKTRLDVTHQLVHGFGLSNSGPLSDEAILAFMQACNAYAHPNGEVRESAKGLTVLLHGLKGPSIERHLTCLRPQQLKEYQAAFEKGGAAEPAARAPAAAAAAAAPAAKKSGAAGGGVASGPTGSAGKAGAGGAGAKGSGSGGAPKPTSMEESDEDEGFCQFCEGCGPNATEQQLDLHYWQECPMLIGCSHCKQIIEIATLTEHLLSECEHRSSFKRCPRCKDAVPAAEHAAHVAARACAPVASAESTCPLCKADVGGDDDGWLVHLVDDGCPANPRNPPR